MSLDNLLNAQENEYVKGGLEANVSEAKAITSKAGKVFFKATLTDGQTRVSATSFSQTFAQYDGKRVQWTGMGLKRGQDFNGTPQLSIGDKAKWTIVGDSTAHEGNSAPQQQSEAPKPSNPRKTQGNAVSGEIPGVTVGMALNKACDLYIRTTQPAEPIDLEDMGLFVHKAASALIRISQALQDGHLAAPVHVAKEPEPPETDEAPF